MSKIRQEQDPIARMGAANPVSAASLRCELAAGEIATAMHRAIAAGSVPAEPIPVGDRFARGPGARRAARVAVPRRAVLVVAAGLACLVAVLALTGLPGGGGGGPEYARAAIEVAEANPRLLVTAPGWSVTGADEFEVDSGEVIFGDGRHQLNVTWYPARLYRGYLRDRAEVSTPSRSTLLGRAATTVDYGREEYATMLAPQGRVFLELRGRLGGRAAYEDVLRSLRPASIDAWLGAMPTAVVTPETRSAAVEEILRDVPVPPHFDLAALKEKDAVRGRDQLTAEVTGAIACGWVESWLAAKRTGDLDGTAAAVDAMASWRRWPALRAPAMRRGWAANIRQAANRIALDRLDLGPAGVSVNPDGSGYEIGPEWSVALGCKPRWRRPLDP